MKWQTKSRYFRLLAALPQGPRLHHLAQRHLTKEWPRPITHLESYRERALKFVEAFQRFSNRNLEDSEFVEIGAGRDLALAVSLRLAGVARVTCIDIERLANLYLINHAARSLGVDRSFETWNELSEFGISYRAPESAEAIAIANSSIDCFCTSEVLEHIPQSSLKSIFYEAHRYLRAGGLHIHAIDYSDHFARSDPAISRFNFLKFTDTEWIPHNSRFQYVNRMRHSDYTGLLHATGFDLLDSDVVLGDLPKEVAAHLAPQFSSYDIDDIRALRSVVVARKALDDDSDARPQTAP
ncbi:hypothetical protein ACVWWG_008962 [Bradyrhizobium sp. LB7.2]